MKSIKMHGKRYKNSLCQVEDRLSSLPDRILVDILSRLEIHNAAATSVLSRRWCGLWTAVTRFEFCDINFNCENPVMDILRQLTAPKLYVFDVILKHMPFDRHNIVQPCFPELVCRNVEQIIINSHYLEVCVEAVRAPPCLFGMQSLVILHLSCWVKFPDDAPAIRLHNLKALHLDALINFPNWLGTLFSSCPLLEHLGLRFNLQFLYDEAHPDLEIFSPNLKLLHIHMNSCGQSPRAKIFIDAPNLTELEIYDSTSCYYFVRKPPEIFKADIHGRHGGIAVGPLAVYRDYMHQMLKSVAAAFSGLQQGQRNICTYLHSLNYGPVPITFPNLVSLRINFNGIGLNEWKELLLSLHWFPNLNHLEANMKSESAVELSIWSAPESIPACFESKLKKIEMTTRLYKNVEELKLLAYILRNAIVLEKLCASVNVEGNNEEAQLWNTRNFCKSLFNLPRGSSKCEIVFSNAYIEASSNDYYNGRLKCQMLRLY